MKRYYRNTLAEKCFTVDLPKPEATEKNNILMYVLIGLGILILLKK